MQAAKSISCLHFTIIQTPTNKSNMEHRHSLKPRPPLLALFFLLYFVTTPPALAEKKANSKRPSVISNKTVSCLLVFGDSTVDPGNNNYIDTLFKSNFPPYGRDFRGHVPTGRFTNGRLTPDFVISYAGLKEYVPPYLDPSVSINELMSGVSFASAGSGYDPLTPAISNVIGIPSQIEYFREYKRRIASLLGDDRTENYMKKKTVFLVSAGTNDFALNYFSLPIRQRAFSVSDYQQFILQYVRQLLQVLWDGGARRIAVTGLPPMGCLPAVITLLNNNTIPERDCIESISSVARQYNSILQTELDSMQAKLNHLDAKIRYIDIYTPLSEMIHGKFGFTNGKTGCCGTGYLEASFLCNPHSYVCPDMSKHVFFDAIHPTEKAYHALFKSSRPIIDEFLKG